MRFFYFNHQIWYLCSTKMTLILRSLCQATGILSFHTDKESAIVELYKSYGALNLNLFPDLQAGFRSKANISMDHAIVYTSSIFERIRPIFLPSNLSNTTWKPLPILSKAVLGTSVSKMYLPQGREIHSHHTPKEQGDHSLAISAINLTYGGWEMDSIRLFRVCLSIAPLSPKTIHSVLFCHRSVSEIGSGSTPIIIPR